MSWTKASFGRTTLLLTAFGLTALLALGAGLVWMVQQTRGYSASVAATQQVRILAGEVTSLVQDAETGQRGYLLTGEDSYLAPYVAARDALPGELAQLLSRVVADGGRPGPIAELRELVTRKLAELEQTIALAEAGDRDGAMAVVKSGVGKVAMDEIRAVLAGVEQRSAARQARRASALEDASSHLLVGATAALVLLAVVSIGVAAVALRYTRALEQAEQEVRRINAGLEERVAMRTAALGEANAELQRFAYIVSHDLRSPLVNVMGFTAELEAALETLRNPAGHADTARIETDIAESIAFIRAATSRMDRLINAILRLSREGSRKLHPEPLDTAALFDNLASSLTHQLGAAGAELVIDKPLPKLTADRIAVEQVFGNLLDNAVKYLDASRPGRIRVRGHNRLGHAVFEVIDNGRGIDPRDRERIFDLFRRAGVQDRPGEGIGLANVRALVRRLGGSITCDNADGHGTVFRVILPAKPPAHEHDQDTPA